MDSNGIARQRAEQIIKVRSGQMSATEAARNLGISRKSYYKWEERALSAMMGALQNQSSGRPGLAVDEEKESLKRKLHEAEENSQHLERRLYVREVMSQPVRDEPKKKERADKRACPNGGKTGASVQGIVRAGAAGVLKPDEVEKADRQAGGAGSETGTAEVR